MQTDKTKEAIVELQKELRGIVGERPVQPDELERAKASLTLTLPGSWETMGAVGGHDRRDRRVRAGRPLLRHLRRQGAGPDRRRASRRRGRATVQPDHLVWVIVGDRARIEPALRELNLGEIHLVDADGNAVPTS